MEENKAMEAGRGGVITMTTDDGENVDFFVVEETRIGGRDYLLVTDAPEKEDGECYVLRDASKREDAEALYEFVENDRELEAVFGVFEELLKDAEIEIEK